MKIIQAPNTPLIIAIIALLVSKLPNSIAHSLGLTIYTIAIIIWSFEEIATGVNLFRRFLGVIVMLSVAYMLFTQLK